MNWNKIVGAFVSSYASERCADAALPDISINEVEPGVWRVLFDPSLTSADGTPECGMIVLTGEKQMRSLPMDYQRFIEDEDAGEDQLSLYGFALQEAVE